MTTNKTPAEYRAPLRSRADITAYIMRHADFYSDRHDRYPVSFNVKAYRVDYDNPKGEYTIDPALDDAWSEYLEANSWIWEDAFENAQSYYAEGLYTSYPGTDRGDFTFYFCGRQGGNLCLAEWAGHTLQGMDEDEFEEWINALPYRELCRFYKALVCMVHDLTPEKASEEVEYQLNFLRYDWEEEQRAEREERAVATAAEIEAARPDLYPGA